MSDLLCFIEYGTSDSGKTKRWEVEARSSHGGDPLALISWYAPWRRYVVYPQTGTLFDASCLLEIAMFLKKQMEARRAK